MNYLITFLFFFLFISQALDLSAQQDSVNLLYDGGKIYGVVFVVLILLIGLIYLLWRIEKKLNRIEKLTDHEHKTS